MASNIFESFTFPQDPPQAEKPEKDKQKSTTAGVFDPPRPPEPIPTPTPKGGLTPAEREAYSRYRRSVSEIPGLSKQINQANRELEGHDGKNSDLGRQVKILEQERSSLQKEKKNLEEELKKTKEGGTGTRMQIREVKCDEQIASWIRGARGSSAMTPTQQSLLEKPCAEVCSGNVLNSVEAVEKLEASFKRGNYIDILANPPVDADAVRASVLKISPWIIGSVFVLLMIAHFAVGTTIASIIEWTLGIIMVASAFMVGRGKDEGKSGNTVGGIIAAVVCLALIGFGMTLVYAGGFFLSAITALVMSILFFIMLLTMSKYKFAKKLLEKTAFCKAYARYDAFRKVEEVPLMNEAMYAYCHHTEIMDYFRNNATKSWIAKLQADIKDKDQQLKAKEQELQAIQKKLSKSEDVRAHLREQALEASTALEDATRAVWTWKKQPDAVCTKNTFSDTICIEKVSKKNVSFVIVDHEIEPIVCYYRGDAEDSSPVDQVADQLAAIIQSFTKMNSANIMQISLVDMLSGPLALSMDMRFQFVNMSELKNFANNKDDVFKGRVFKVIGNEELRELTKQLEEHCRSMQEFTASHIHQIKGGHSDIKQVNELLIAAGQEPKKYHVVCVIVPRAGDRDDLGKQDVVRYLNTKNSKDFGILPIFFVNENSIHPDWKPTLDKCKKNVIKL